MIAKLIPLLCLAMATLALATKSLAGVDPNTLFCDPKGLQFLLLPSYDDCSKFYKCVLGQEIELSCGFGTIFDFELQACNWKWSTTCILRTPPGEESEEVEGSGDSSIEWTHEGNGVQVVGQAEEVKERVLGAQYFSQTMLNCRNTEDTTRQVAYRGDCQRYWRCVSGVPQAVFCSDGLFFNEASQQCDFEANVRCLVETVDEINGEFITA